MPVPLAAANESRFLLTLQRLLAIPATDLRNALSHAADALAEATRADKVDTFLYDEARDSLVAVGTSAQPLSAKQRALGLDVLPLSNGGRVAEVYRTGEPHFTGRLQDDPHELRGIREGLGVQSQIGVPLEVGCERRGLIMIASRAPDFFTDLDQAFLASAARWVGLVAEHSELVSHIERNALEAGRTITAQETITVLAHDLRNYLSPVSLRLYRLRARAEGEARPEDRDDAEVALRGITRLTALVSDLLDSARLDSGVFTVTRQPVDVAALVHDAAAALAASDHAIEVKVFTPLTVAADAPRLRQCLDNVLTNALAHSPPHAPVHVFVGAQFERGRQWARIEVVDEGPGVDEAVLPHLFEQFTTSREQGVGLGLYIAKRIATAHGGDVIVDRYPGKGARFTLRLPALPAAPGRDDAPPLTRGPRA